MTCITYAGGQPPLMTRLQIHGVDTSSSTKPAQFQHLEAMLMQQPVGFSNLHAQATCWIQVDLFNYPTLNDLLTSIPSS